MKQYNVGSLNKWELGGGLALWLASALSAPALLAAVVLGWLGVRMDEVSAAVTLTLIQDVLLLTLLVLVLRRHYLREQWARCRARGGKRILLDAAIGFGVYIVSQRVVATAVSVAAGLLLPEYHNENQELVEEIATVQPGLGVAMIVLLAPVTEELLYRGVLFAGLHRKHRIAAYAVSAAAFALLHVLGALFSQSVILSLLNFGTYLVPGLILAWVYEHSGTIFAPMLLHAGINALSLVLLFMFG